MKPYIIKKNLNNERDDTWRRKGHIHEGKEVVPEVCPNCKGFGYVLHGNTEIECQTCGGEGYVYE